jgi:predicted GNAT family N-acyltransferase
MKPRLEGVEIDDVVGTARLVPGKYSGLFQVERVSVVKEARGQGLARELVSELEKEACIRYKEIGAIYLTGEPIAENLYNKIGYYLIPNSKHINYNVWMIKMIKPINEYWKNKDNWNKI